jgi:hypothetical protein
VHAAERAFYPYLSIFEYLFAKTHSDLLETAHNDGYDAVEFGANTVLLPERTQVAQNRPLDHLSSLLGPHPRM